MMSFTSLMVPGPGEALGNCSMTLRRLTCCSSEPRVDLVRLEITRNPQILRDEIIRLVGAHSEDIVRSVYVDELVSQRGVFAKTTSDKTF